MEFIQLMYSLWPLILAGVFIGKAPSKKNFFTWLRSLLFPVFILWCIWAAGGLWLFIRGISPLGWIPEPWNTILFGIVGLFLTGITIGPIWNKHHKNQSALLTAKSIEELRLLSPDEFEELIAAYFEMYDFKVRRVGRTGDHGIDLVVYTRQGEKWVVQCKRWKGQVGEPVIRDLFGAMHHEHAHKAFLMNTGSFTPQAYQWAKGKPITLYNGEGLVRLLRRVQNNSQKTKKFAK